MPAASPQADPNPTAPYWHLYRTGGEDRAGRKIQKLYAVDDNYVIYFVDCELFYEIATGVAKDLGAADSALARINRLLPDNPENENDPVYRNKFSTLELVADGYEMIFCGEATEGLQILKGIEDKLQTTEEGKRRLMYQAGTVCVTVVLLCLYLIGRNTSAPGWQTWLLTALLAGAGGVFSVCLNLGSLEVNVNQEKGFLLSAGATRSLVAVLGGIALLLAMRSKMFAGIAYKGDPPSIGDALTIAEMFFCFLAGFSESFVPNILRNSEKTSSDGKDSSSQSRGNSNDSSNPQPEPEDNNKVPSNKTSEEKAASQPKGGKEVQ